MYKRFKLTQRLSISFNTFPKTAKKVSKVYLGGIRNWTAMDSYNYSIVINRFRIIFSIGRKQYYCQKGKQKP